MSVRRASSNAFSAFFAVSSTGTLPATVVMASTWISSGDARAARKATASSGEGSVSKITSMSLQSLKKRVLPPGNVHFPDDRMLPGIGPDGSIARILGDTQAVDNAHTAGEPAIDRHIHPVTRGDEG